MTATVDRPTWGPGAWKPVRVGELYCSPACGRPCTWDMHQAAIKLSNETAALLGDGYKARVWENLGWHAEAVSACGRIKVIPSVYSGVIHGYTAFVGEASSGGGRWAEHGDTPKAAVEAALAKAKAEHDALVELLKGLI